MWIPVVPIQKHKNVSGTKPNLVVSGYIELFNIDATCWRINCITHDIRKEGSAQKKTKALIELTCQGFYCLTNCIVTISGLV